MQDASNERGAPAIAIYQLHSIDPRDAIGSDADERRTLAWRMGYRESLFSGSERMLVSAVPDSQPLGVSRVAKPSARAVSERDLVQTLVRRGNEILRRPRSPVPFTGDAEADAFLNDLTGYPHAFVLGCIADRQMKAERAWIIPYRINEQLGGFSLDALRRLSVAEFRTRLTEPQVLHRFPEEIARSFHSAIERIATEYGGSASGIWSGEPSSATVVYRLLQFRGAGPKIATMAANILARQFKVVFSDYYSVDISADVHIKRVFGRLGLCSLDASPEQVVYRARSLHPDFPGLLDFPIWEVGRAWCKPQKPNCSACYLRTMCASSGMVA